MTARKTPVKRRTETLFDLPPDAVEITISLGFVPSGDHAQWQVEVKDPATGQLLALASRPHLSMARMMDTLEEASREAIARMFEFVAPF